MSIVIAVQASIFQLNSVGKQAVIQVTEQKAAVNAIIAALKYSVFYKKRYKMQVYGNLNDDYIPSVEEVKFYRKRMMKVVKKFKNVREKNEGLKEED